MTKKCFRLLVVLVASVPVCDAWAEMCKSVTCDGTEKPTNYHDVNCKTKGPRRCFSDGTPGGQIYYMDDCIECASSLYTPTVVDKATPLSCYYNTRQCISNTCPDECPSSLWTSDTDKQDVKCSKLDEVVDGRMYVCEYRCKVGFYNAGTAYEPDCTACPSYYEGDVVKQGLTLIPGAVSQNECYEPVGNGHVKMQILFPDSNPIGKYNILEDKACFWK